MWKSPLGFLRIVGYSEGTSFLVLLGIAMPLKYLANFPEAVLVVGWIHGILFVLYAVAAFRAKFACGWSIWRLAGAALASVLPFGPFIFEARLRRDGLKATAEQQPNTAPAPTS